MGFAPSTFESRGFAESGEDDVVEEDRDFANACLIESIRPQAMRVILHSSEIDGDREWDEAASSLLTAELRQLKQSSPVD